MFFDPCFDFVVHFFRFIWFEFCPMEGSVTPVAWGGGECHIHHLVEGNQGGEEDYQYLPKHTHRKKKGKKRTHASFHLHGGFGGKPQDKLFGKWNLGCCRRTEDPFLIVFSFFLFFGRGV